MKFKHFLMATALLPLAACSSLQNGARETTLSDNFADALRASYIDLADFEREQGDIFDARNYEAKVNGLVNGTVPSPEVLSEWDLPTEYVDELTEARRGLTTALNGGARTASPTLAAKAQASFDCWVEQQEENFQPEHIKACKDDFLGNMTALNDAMKPKPVAKKPEAPKQPEVVKPRVIEMPGEYIVFFNFDKAQLTEGAKAVLNDIAQAIGKYNPRQVIINGHTDRVGTVSYNLSLSEDRAKKVAKYLQSVGVDGSIMQVTGYGELQPRVTTADGVREAENRFVNIIMVK